MSQSPLERSDAKDALDQESAFRVGLSRMNQLVRDGASFSGHERNCVYLNTGRDRFANISAVSGLDFSDDARAHALVDWDGDGDLDLWTANRTAPQMRFLRNDASQRNHFIALKLQGSTCNRDAIGARVEVVLEGRHDQKLVKSLRAGEGFLGQSTKWLHFGLGRDAAIEKLLVHWPGDRAPQAILGVRPNRFYVITQHQPEPQCVPHDREVRLEPKPIETGSGSAAERVVLSSRVPMPSLDYQTFSGETKSLDRWRGSPLLLNLWAAWCQPCVMELKLFAKEHRRLQTAGLKLIALSVDGVTGSTDSNPDRAAKLLSGIGPRLESGLATQELVDMLQYLGDVWFSQHRTMPLPCSLLVDRDGCIAVIYRGVVSIDELLADVARLSLSETEWSRAALPFPGRWNRAPSPPNELVVPLHLIRNGRIDETLSFVTRFDRRLATDREYPRLLVWLGDELFNKGSLQAGLRQYERALGHDPSYVPALNNLAWKLATHGDPTIRDERKAVDLAQRAAAVTNYQNPAVLDTLATALAAAGRFADAAATAEKALHLARQQRQAELVRIIESNLREYRGAVPSPQKESKAVPR